MEEQMDIKEILMQEFKDDPIYRLVKLKGLEEYLFTDGILSLNTETTYSTVETGRIIERSDSTIRNHFRSDLIEYIAPEKYGKYYRLNYQSIFRLHMIFLLMEKASKTSIDLLAELGMQPSVLIGGNIKRVHRTDHDDRIDSNELMAETEQYGVEDRFLKLEQAIGLQGIMLNILKYEKDIADIDRKLDNTRYRMNQLTAENRMKYLEEKQSLLLTSSLKNSLKKSSFLGFLKKSDDFDIKEISTQIEGSLKPKYDKEIEDKIKEYEAEISKFEEEKKGIQDLLRKEKEVFEKVQLEQNKTNLIEKT